VYIIDSGATHTDEFKDGDTDRLVDEINISSDKDWTDTADRNGHGTPVAAAVGSKTYGIAKSATLRAVKCERDGKPDVARLTQALQDIIRRHNTRKKEDNFKGSIINMSFRLAYSSSVADELKKAFDAGISLVACESRLYP